MSRRISVAFVGAGAVVQSIHLPTLARLSDRFQVNAIWDINHDLARTIAERASARAAESLHDLLADPAIEVVAICSPPHLHAEHAIAAMRAGKRAVFVEKPLGTSLDEAERIAIVASETNTPLFVGAMHTFDPAWLAARAEIATLAAEAHTIRSSIVLPFNQRYEHWAFEPLPGAAPPAPPVADLADPSIRKRFMRMGLLELASHDLPIVRSFVPAGELVAVTAADLFQPFGYGITLRVGDRIIDLFGLLRGQWKPCWQFEAISEMAALQIEFTPSFVHAGSAVWTMTRGGTSVSHASTGQNGYEGEWLAIHTSVETGNRPPSDASVLVDDLKFLIEIADQACMLMDRRVAA